MDLDILTGRSLGMLAMDLVIVFIVLLLARFLYGVAAGINTTRELAVSDNFAIGISLAGATAGVAIMLTGVASGSFAPSFGAEAASMASYAVLGLILMWLTRLIFDKAALPAISVKKELAGGNSAVAVVDAGNLLATAVMVRAVMIWSEGALVAGLIAVVVGYVVSQIILTATAYYRIWLFRMRKSGGKFHEVVQGGNIAVALRFAGFQIGVALAVTAASSLAPHAVGGNPLIEALQWGLLSVGVAIVLAVLAWVAERVVLAGIDLGEEVDTQRNIGVALMEVAVYVAVGFVLLSHVS